MFPLFIYFFNEYKPRPDLLLSSKVSRKCCASFPQCSNWNIPPLKSSILSSFFCFSEMMSSGLPKSDTYSTLRCRLFLENFKMQLLAWVLQYFWCRNWLMYCNSKNQSQKNFLINCSFTSNSLCSGAAIQLKHHGLYWRHFQFRFSSKTKKCGKRELL